MKQALLRVRRGAKNDEPRYDLYPVPYEEGMSVLDGLMWVRRGLDSSLAVRYSCINANACKECTALVDGQVAYLCMARLRDGEMTIEPLATRPLIRDLVTDIVPPGERLPGRKRGA